MKNTVIGDNIRDLLKKRNLSQNALAEMVGTSRQQIGAYVNGRHAPNQTALISIAEALGVTQYDLTGTPEDKEIVRLGRVVSSSPALCKIVDLFDSGNLTEEKLQAVFTLANNQ